MDFKLQFCIEISYLGVRPINLALKSKLKFGWKCHFWPKNITVLGICQSSKFKANELYSLFLKFSALGLL